MVAPMSMAGLEPTPGWAVLLVAPLALLALGVWRRSIAALLLGVPLGWSLSAFHLPQGAWTLSGSAVALAGAMAYLVAALLWCRRGGAGAEELALTWQNADDASSLGSARPWLGGWLVAGPVLGAALWPGCLEGAYQGFPQAPGIAQVGLVLLGLLVGLAIGSDLLRPRPAPTGRRRRAVMLAMVGGLCLTGYGIWV